MDTSGDSAEVTIRPAAREDAALIAQLIHELADYERLAHEAQADAASIEKTLFAEDSPAEALIAYSGGEAAGFCLFFHNYSTFLARKGLYIEDVFVRPSYRGRGIGKRLFAECARIAQARNCGRMEWWVLNWNEPAITFYENLGARAMREWTVYRLAGDELNQLATTQPAEESV